MLRCIHPRTCRNTTCHTHLHLNSCLSHTRRVLYSAILHERLHVYAHFSGGAAGCVPALCVRVCGDVCVPWRCSKHMRASCAEQKHLCVWLSLFGVFTCVKETLLYENLVSRGSQASLLRQWLSTRNRMQYMAASRAHVP